MRILSTATFAGVAGSIPIGILSDFGYRFDSVELLFVTSSIAIMGGAIGWITAGSAFFSYLLGLTIYTFSDIYLFHYTTPQLVLSLVFLGGICLLLRATGTRLLPVILTFTLFFSISGLFKPLTPEILETGHHNTNTTFSQPDDSILHIVLDEMTSPIGTLYPPEQKLSAARFVENLAEIGFHVDAQAFSKYDRTVYSLSTIMALDNNRPNFQRPTKDSTFSYRTATNTYLQVLVDQGYKVSVLQSNFLDFCHDNSNIVCRTYSRVGHADNFTEMSIRERVHYAFLTVNDALNSSSRAGVFLYRAVPLLFGKNKLEVWSITPIVALNLMRSNVVETAASISPGEAVYIHLLAPHFPYIYNETCEVNDISDWALPPRLSNGADATYIYKSYWNQFSCVQSALMEIIHATQHKEYLTIIIHGDHGARILMDTPQENKEDSLLSFVAVRSPGQTPGIQMKPVFLQDTVIDVLDKFLK